MEIFFEWELDDEIPTPPQYRQDVLEEIRTFLTERFKVLEDEVDATQVGNNIPFVVILFREQFGLSYMNIPNALIEKLASCFTEEEYGYIIKKVSKKIEEQSNLN